MAGTVEEGETYEKNIIKDAKEELSIENINVKRCPKIKIDGKHKYFIQWFYCNLNKSIKNFKIQKQEVAEIRWFSKEELKKEIKNNPREFLNGMDKYLEFFY